MAKSLSVTLQSASRETIIEAPVRTESIRRAYDLFSSVYFLVAPLERKERLRAVERAALQPNDRVLEVAVGSGTALVEILKRVGAETVVHGVDLSPRMVEKARRAAARAGFTNIDIRESDARSLPFEDGLFDVLVNAYMLNLIPLAEFPLVLGEFRRVLRPGGRLVLLNGSKDRPTTLWERLYRLAPRSLVPYLFGGCRPVLVAEDVRAAGFQDVRRELIKSAIPSELVTAKKREDPLAPTTRGT